MSSEWPSVPVEDVCELIVDCVNKTAPVVSEATPYRMIRTTNVRSGRIDLSECRYVDQTTYEKWTRRARLEVGDVVLTREAPIGEVGLVQDAMGVFLGQRLMQYRADRRVLEPRFLLYSFLSPELQHQFGSHEGSGSVVSHIRVGDCFRFMLRLPPLEVQSQIADILGALDDRITLLRETNATLEAIAQALFKSWFVDFDPVRAKAEGRSPNGMDEATAALFPDGFEESELGLVPRGWSLRPLASAYDINPKRQLKKGASAPYADMASAPTSGHGISGHVVREAGSGSRFINGDTLLARITPCLENGKTAFVDFLADDEVGWGSTEFIVLRPKAPLPAFHAYLLCRHAPFRDFAIQSMSGTSGRQRVQNDILGRYPIAVPSTNVAEAFASIVDALWQRVAANNRQAQTLATLRDTLLPRLISGQLRLPEAEVESLEVIA
ncbi:restriction endonuclease subunit S [Azoarcus taiwanensis]|uniref:Restriction endonuclease subunit S n=1 Tax=Azoarcus taiwanensis TaxID=666964 RepID=A0A972F7N8_9RHOO|nr:restriction endonuclease subunit S [Azoarcus taiwanensis]NMG03358.1 restriction endonuclease subunit S [Azoarcus taiwanensis]